MMSLVEFDQSLLLGLDVIDAQHRRYFHLLRDLIHTRQNVGDREAVSEALFTLVEYVSEHFRDEEQIMRDAGYPGLEAHRALHAGFVRKILEFYRKHREKEHELKAEVVRYLEEWFVKHVRSEDPKFVPFVTASNR